MLLLIRLVGLLFVVAGIIFLLNPGIMKPYIAFWQKGKRITVGGLLNLLFAVLFLYSASRCRIPVVISILGIMSLAKGVMILLFGPEKMKAVLKWWDDKPASTIRILAPIVIAFGILIIYSV